MIDEFINYIIKNKMPIRLLSMPPISNGSVYLKESEKNYKTVCNFFYNSADKILYISKTDEKMFLENGLDAAIEYLNLLIQETKNENA